MARLSLIVFALVLLMSTANALITETMIMSIIVLNIMLGGNIMNMVLAGVIEDVGALTYAVDSLSNNGPIGEADNIPSPNAVYIVKNQRRRREVLEENVENSTNDKPDIINMDKYVLELQDDIYKNLQNIAHDVAGEISVHLGLPVHTLEAIFNGEKDAPNLEDVVDTVAKHLNVPKYVIMGLHSLFERAAKYEDDYDDAKPEEEMGSPSIIN